MAFFKNLAKKLKFDKAEIIELYKIELAHPKSSLIHGKNPEGALLNLIKRLGYNNMEFGLLVSIQHLPSSKVFYFASADFLLKHKIVSQEQFDVWEKEFEDLT